MRRGGGSVERSTAVDLFLTGSNDGQRLAAVNCCVDLDFTSEDATRIQRQTPKMDAKKQQC